MIPILICGSRSFDNGLILPWTLRDLLPIADQITIITGECPPNKNTLGAAYLAKLFAQYYNIKYEAFPADWENYGKAAGPIRNEEMKEYIKVHPQAQCRAFWDRSSPGTRDMIKRARAAGIKTKIHHILPEEFYIKQVLLKWQNEWKIIRKKF